MFYCEYCQRAMNESDLNREQKCFEDEYGVAGLFPDKHYYTDYNCPVCGGEVVDAMQCEMCGEWLPEDLLTDTTEYINGGVGYCCEGCMQDADMRAI